MKEIDKIFEINESTVVKKIIAFIKEQYEKARAEKAIVGLSGGIDSSVVATLTTKALGSNNVIALLLPSAYTSQNDIDDAKKIVNMLQVSMHYVNITNIVNAFKATLKVEDRIVLGNIMARIRMTILYSFANKFNGIVIGTGNKTELLVGYFTKYGDGGVDILPIGDLYKTDVRRIAVYLGIPKQIILKPPTAGLWPGQTDEGELGITYDLLDRILAALIELKMDKKAISHVLNIDLKTIEKVEKMVRLSEHKRNPPPVAKIR